MRSRFRITFGIEKCWAKTIYTKHGWAIYTGDIEYILSGFWVDDKFDMASIDSMRKYYIMPHMIKTIERIEDETE